MPTFSLKKSVQQNKQTKEISKKQKATTNSKLKLFTQTDLDQTKKRFLNIYTDEHYLINILQSAIWSLEKETEVVINVYNNADAEKIEENDSLISSFLRKQLENDNIHVKTKIITPPASMRYYTSQERFELMVKENPSILKLKNLLKMNVS